MEDEQEQEHDPSRFSSNYGPHNHHTPAPAERTRTRTGTRINTSSRRCSVPVADEECAGDPIKCSGKCCRSCTGGVVADCVAICCCPCAVISILALALVKIPWTIGRRCLGAWKKKGGTRRKMEKQRKLSGTSSSCDSMLDTEGIWGKEMVENGTLEIVLGGDEEEENLSEERVWSELYQFGHLGFGRVSFTGNGFPSQAKGQLEKVIH